MLRMLRPLVLALAVLVISGPVSAQARSGPPGFADLAERLLPAVVNISTTQTITSRDDLPELPPDMQLPPGSPFEEFFKDFMERRNQGGNTPGGKGSHGKPRKATSLGSGFVVDPAGYIVTNNHVIQDADEITVILQDDTNLSATVVGKDKKTDLALLKVNYKKPLPSVPFGDSDKVRVGDWIIAIGDPYGLGGTVTAGIISARARDISSGPYDEYLQTDASINRGNSGGPMFNLDGEVVGVNTAIFSPSGGSIGIGFAIPSSLARNVVDQLREHGHIQRGWLGVRIQMVTQDIADSLGLEKTGGALVSSVTPEGPAAVAGLQPGDVILTFDGRTVGEMRRLPLMVAETPVNKTIDVVVFRKGEKVTVKVKIGELDQKDDSDAQPEEEEAPTPKAPAADKVPDLGISVAPLTDDLRTKFSVKKDVSGLIVTAVNSDGLAADQGLQAGDVLSEASQQDLKSPKDLIDLVHDAKKDNKPLLLLINRKDDLRFIAITFGKKKEKEKEKEKAQ